MIKSRKRMVAIGAGVCLFALVAYAGTEIVLPIATEKKVEKTKTILRAIRTAVESKFVDDCGGLPQWPDSKLPPELSTPISYLGELPNDPFGSDHESFLYISQDKSGNSALYVIASKGPDKDFDVLRYGNWIEYYPPHQKDDGHWTKNEASYTDSNGSTIAIDPVEIRAIPRINKNSGERWYSPSELIEEFAQYGVAFYDPTNGILSDGDLITTNAR